MLTAVNSCLNPKIYAMDSGKIDHEVVRSEAFDSSPSNQYYHLSCTPKWISLCFAVSLEILNRPSSQSR